jgi:putative membrane protein
MMGWYHDGLGWGGWLVMVIGMIAFWGLVVTAVIALTRDSTPSDRSPERILEERFARGEIDAEEYHARMAALLSHSAASVGHTRFRASH